MGLASVLGPRLTAGLAAKLPPRLDTEPEYCRALQRLSYSWSGHRMDSGGGLGSGPALWEHHNVCELLGEPLTFA